MEDVLSLQGPVLKVNGQLILVVPLVDGGREWMGRAETPSETREDFLKIVIPEWLAGILEIEEGDLVGVQSDGTLRIKPPSPERVN